MNIAFQYSHSEEQSVELPACLKGYILSYHQKYDISVSHFPDFSWTGTVDFILPCTLDSVTIFVSSKAFRIRGPPQKRQGSDTRDFQDKSHDLTSTGIPRKRGKYALSFQENRVIDQWET